MRAWLAAAAALGCAGRAMAGYVTVSMTEARQCNSSLVEWSGDDGPYHLLYTPTTFAAHSYNSIPNGTMSYNLTIDQAEGTQYMVTVWGASGITKAGTTDVLSIGAPYNASTDCFWTDAEILSLYTFSFNITNLDDAFPPQCSNLSMTWPTSLESNVTGTTARRAFDYDSGDPRRAWDAPAMPPARRAGEEAPALAGLPPLNRRTLRRRYGEAGGTWSDAGPPAFLAAGLGPRATTEIDNDESSSSNKTSGNTTAPPTMFGIIPLGNSFSIPITYSSHSKYAGSLPESSLSTTPTTWTSQGVTHLNWTVDLAKGTRFILVAGIGSEEEWASGGSSEMLTVGQGSTGCIGSEQSGGGAPSVTATGTSSFVPTATATSDPASQPAHTSWRGVIIACVFSAVGTLIIVGAFWCCCRVRRRRRLAAGQGQTGLAALVGRPAKGDGRAADGDTELDLVSLRNDDGSTTTPARPGRPVLFPLSDTHGSGSGSGSGSLTSPTSPALPTALGGRPAYAPAPSTDSYASPISPARPGLAGAYDRHESMDRLLPHGAGYSGSPVPSGAASRASSSLGMGAGLAGVGAYDSPAPRERRPRGPLVLHDPGARAGDDDDGDGDGDGEPGEADGRDIAELKRDTLAYLGASTAGPSASPADGERRRQRRRDDDAGMSYVVHRDAGRVRQPARAQQRVMELPPRYEELDWEAERAREGEVGGGGAGAGEGEGEGEDVGDASGPRGDEARGGHARAQSAAAGPGLGGLLDDADEQAHTA